MTDILERLRSRGEEWILLLVFSFWSFVWDYTHFLQYARQGRMKFFLLAAAAVAAIRIGRRWTPALGLFYLYVVGSYLHFTMYVGAGINEMFLLTGTLFLAPELAEIPRWAFEHILIAASAVHAGIGFFNMQGYYVLPVKAAAEGNAAVGLLGQPTILGPFLACGAALALVQALERRGWGRLLALVVPALIAYAVFLTKSSMSYGALAGGFGLIGFYFFGWRGVGATIFTASLAASIRARVDGNLFWHSGRTLPWGWAWELIQQRPWFGYGPGAWALIAEAMRRARGDQNVWDFLHSDPLTLLLELGSAGVALLLLPAAAIVRNSIETLRSRDREVLPYLLVAAILGADSCGNFVLHLVPHGPLFAVCCYRILKSRGPLECPRPRLPLRLVLLPAALGWRIRV